jgi:putative phosphoesterase
VSIRLGIIGDTQGRFDVEQLIVKSREVFAGVDEVWHAGDWQYPEVLEGLATIAPLTVVNGNAPDDPRYPMQVVREIEGLRVGMVHRPPSPGDPWVRELNVCIHGHTHKWRNETVGGVLFINVASATGAWFSRDRTAGLLDLDRGQAALTPIDLKA